MSSFMGMNTTDIRDIGHDQGLFWSIAVPVTACVVVLALSYGYKGEEILDWIHVRARRHERPPGGGDAGNDGGILGPGLDRRLTGTWQSKASKASGASWARGQTETW